MNNEDRFFLPHTRLQALIDALQQAGFACIAPQVRDGAIVYAVLDDADKLPWGMRDHQVPGAYRLEKIDAHQAFAFSNGPQAIKPQLFKPREVVWRVVRNASGQLVFEPNQAESEPIAMIGARACDLAAMAIQDNVFLQRQHVDPHYQARRNQLFVVAVNCSYSSQNCFCVSAGSGPEVKQQYDLLMTEIHDGFVVQAGSERGQDILLKLQLDFTKKLQDRLATDVIQKTIAMQTKVMPLNNNVVLRDLLFSNLNHPHWEEVASRCLSCGNCTQVCPTCFCHSEVEAPDLDGHQSDHVREWDSCFTAGHSYISGKVVRDDTAKRYRQWLTHKVGSWFDQFGESGCVGCGRCISWCPVGIDITESLKSIVEDV